MLLLPSLEIISCILQNTNTPNILHALKVMGATLPHDENELERIRKNISNSANKKHKPTLKSVKKLNLFLSKIIDPEKINPKTINLDLYPILKYFFSTIDKAKSEEILTKHLNDPELKFNLNYEMYYKFAENMGFGFFKNELTQLQLFFKALLNLEQKQERTEENILYLIEDNPLLRELLTNNSLFIEWDYFGEKENIHLETILYFLAVVEIELKILPETNENSSFMENYLRSLIEHPEKSHFALYIDFLESLDGIHRKNNVFFYSLVIEESQASAYRSGRRKPSKKVTCEITKEDPLLYHLTLFLRNLYVEIQLDSIKYRYLNYKKFQELAKNRHEIYKKKSINL